MNNHFSGSFSLLSLLQTVGMYVVLVGLLVSCLFGTDDEGFVSEAGTFHSPDSAAR